MSAAPPDRGHSTTLVVDAFPYEGGAEPLAAPPPPSGAAHLLAGLRFVLARPRPLLFLCAWLWLAALVPALVVAESAARHLAHAPVSAAEGPADLRGATPAWLFREWQRAGGSELAAAATALLPLLLASSLFGLLAAAGWMHAALRGRERHGLRAFLGGGGRMCLPFLRSWLLGLPLFALWTWLVWGRPGTTLVALWLPGGAAELAASESLARAVTHAREILYIAGLFALELLLDVSRATLVVGRRSSALLALGRGARELTRRPQALLLLAAAGLGLELLWIGAVRGASLALGWGPIAIGLVLPFGRVACRGARLAGLATFVAAAEAARAGRRARRAAAEAQPEEYAAL